RAENISQLRKRIGLFGGNRATATSYSNRVPAIRVDTPHKVDIIAVGGKLGNPVYVSLQRSEPRYTEHHPPSVRRRCRSGAVPARRNPGKGERLITDDSGPDRPTDGRRPDHTRAPGARWPVPQPPAR